MLGMHLATVWRLLGCGCPHETFPKVADKSAEPVNSVLIGPSSGGNPPYLPVPRSLLGLPESDRLLQEIGNRS